MFNDPVSTILGYSYIAGIKCSVPHQSPVHTSHHRQQYIVSRKIAVTGGIPQSDKLNTSMKGSQRHVLQVRCYVNLVETFSTNLSHSHFLCILLFLHLNVTNLRAQIILLIYAHVDMSLTYLSVLSVLRMIRSTPGGICRASNTCAASPIINQLQLADVHISKIILTR